MNKEEALEKLVELVPYLLGVEYVVLQRQQVEDIIDEAERIASRNENNISQISSAVQNIQNELSDIEWCSVELGDQGITEALESLRELI